MKSHLRAARYGGQAEVRTRVRRKKAEPGDSPLALDDVRTTFLNVDLNVWSKTDPTPLARALGDSVGVQFVDRTPRKHWVHFTLSTLHSEEPSAVILAFAALLRRLPPDARRIWDRATREFDVGFQGGLEPSSAEWVLDAKTVQAAAACGARIRITIYSPKLLVALDRSDPPST